MSVVLVDGADRALGRRVVELALADPTVTSVLALVGGAAGGESEVELPRDERIERIELSPTLDVVEVLAGLRPTDLVLLAPSEGPDADGSGLGGVDLARCHRLLGSFDGGHVVALSSATVYGAWPDNPVPLTEDAVARPCPELDFARDKRDLERAVVEWADAGGEERSAAVLRPTIVLSEDHLDWMARSLWQGLGLRTGTVVQPVQFVHLDDLASAIDVARLRRHDGPLNVAPDGWISASELEALVGSIPRLPLRRAARRRLADLAWRLDLTSTPPGVAVYLEHPWVVSNGVLRALGWEPTHSNEEAFVVGSTAGAVVSVSARRRQELALGAAAAAAVGAVVAGTGVLKRLSNRR